MLESSQTCELLNVKNLTSMVNSFNNPNNDSDVIFHVKSKKFYAHRKIVATASNFFKTLLIGPFAESTKVDIPLCPMTFEDNFSVILTYIYQKELQLEQLNNLQVCELFQLADYFDLPDLGSKVQTYVSNLKFYNLTIDSVSTLINLASVKSFKSLYEVTETFIFANAQVFFEHPSFLELRKNVLIDLLKSDALYTDDEFKIFVAVLKWYDANSENSKVNVSELTNDHSNKSTVSSSSVPIEKVEKTSTHNSLETLMKWVRIPNVNILSLYKYKALKDENVITKLIRKYDDEIIDICMGYNEIKRPPRIYQPLVFDVIVPNIMSEKYGTIEEVYLAKNMRWKIKVTWSEKHNDVNVFLKCNSDKENWQCHAKYSIRVVSNHCHYEDLLLSDDNYPFCPAGKLICKAPFVSLSSARGTYYTKQGKMTFNIFISPQDTIYL